MENEKRLIDANTLLKRAYYEDEELVVAVEDIEKAPTVDAVEVVRCRDCKAYDSECGYCEAMGFTCRQNDFCSYGERKVVE